MHRMFPGANLRSVSVSTLRSATVPLLTTSTLTLTNMQYLECNQRSLVINCAVVIGCFHKCLEQHTRHGQIAGENYSCVDGTRCSAPYDRI